MVMVESTRPGISCCAALADQVVTVKVPVAVMALDTGTIVTVAVGASTGSRYQTLPPMSKRRAAPIPARMRGCRCLLRCGATGGIGVVFSISSPGSGSSMCGASCCSSGEAPATVPSILGGVTCSPGSRSYTLMSTKRVGPACPASCSSVVGPTALASFRCRKYSAKSSGIQPFCIAAPFSLLVGFRWNKGISSIVIHIVCSADGDDHLRLAVPARLFERECDRLKVLSRSQEVRARIDFRFGGIAAGELDDLHLAAQVERDKMAWMCRRVGVSNDGIHLKGPGIAIVQRILRHLPPVGKLGEQHPAKHHKQHGSADIHQPMQPGAGSAARRWAHPSRFRLWLRLRASGSWLRCRGPLVLGLGAAGAWRDGAVIMLHAHDRARIGRLDGAVAAHTVRHAGRIVVAGIYSILFFFLELVVYLYRLRATGSAARIPDLLALIGLVFWMQS